MYNWSISFKYFEPVVIYYEHAAWYNYPALYCTTLKSPALKLHTLRLFPCSIRHQGKFGVYIICTAIEFLAHTFHFHFCWNSPLIHLHIESEAWTILSWTEMSAQSIAFQDMTIPKATPLSSPWYRHNWLIAHTQTASTSRVRSVMWSRSQFELISEVIREYYSGNSSQSMSRFFLPMLWFNDTSCKALGDQ